MNYYVALLNKQFRKSLGTRFIDINSKSYKSEFINWLSERMKISETYLSVLDKLDLLYNDESCIEIGKGVYDSIVAGNGKTTIITPFTENLTKVKNNVIEGQLRMFGESFVVVNNDENLTKIEYINSNYYSTLMTHNPLLIYDINNWEDIHNCNELDIIVGMFGFVYDKDRKEKINVLKELRDKLNYDSYKMNCETIGDAYYAVIGSKKLEKRVKE